MVRGKSLFVLVMAVLVAVGCFGMMKTAIAGEGRGQRGQGGDRAGRMEEFRQQAAERMKTSLDATDEEWKVLQPRIEKVQTLSRQMQGGMAGMFGAGRRPGANPAGGEAPAPQTELEKKTQDLTKLLENKDAKPEEIKASLTALRDERAKVKAELDKARKELVETLSVRQEAQLVMMGMIE